MRLRTAGVIALPASGRLSVSQRTWFSISREQLLVDVDFAHCRSHLPSLRRRGVEGDRAAGPHDQRVDVELGDVVGEIHGEARRPS